MDPPLPAATDTWDKNQPLPVVPGAKMRLMCSYGGHIIPRPHDKSLCYVGGDTRMVVVDRQSSLSDLCSRLSRTLFNGRDFSIKYQLPNEDLDSLVSVTTDEDLENMIEEYDRTNGGGKLSRLRLFLFVSKPETAASMGSLLDDAKSENWFVDALNSAAFLPRGLSDSAATEQLLEFEPIVNVETNSSFGSGSSSSMANLPPIRVRVDEGGNLQGQMVGLDEQLSQISIVNPDQKQDEEKLILSTPPPLPIHIGVNRVGSNENIGRVFSDDERSDQGPPTGFRKPPLPLLPVQRKITHDGYNLPSPDSKQSGTNNLPSPDSVASDTSIASANSLSKQSYYQDTTSNSSRPPPANLISPTKTNNSDPITQIQDPSLYIQAPQQHYFQTINAPYMHHPSSAQVPVPSYYQMYAPPHQPYQQQMDQQQYKLYRMPVTQQAQPYNMNNIQQSINPADSQPVNPQVNQIYQTNQAGHTMVPVSNQYQQQYVNVNVPHQMVHLPQSGGGGGGGGGGNYGYDYAQPTSEQVYNGQHLVAPAAPQYQTMNPATAVLLSQHVDNSNQHI